MIHLRENASKKEGILAGNFPANSLLTILAKFLSKSAQDNLLNNQKNSLAKYSNRLLL